MSGAPLLLDTHQLLWAAFEPDRLSAKARKTLQSRESPLAFSLASIWEVAIKTSWGSPDFAVDPGLLHSALLAEGLVELPIRATHLVRVAALPWVHRDPFDRLLVAARLAPAFRSARVAGSIEPKDHPAAIGLDRAAAHRIGDRVACGRLGDHLASARLPPRGVPASP